MSLSMANKRRSDSIPVAFFVCPRTKGFLEITERRSAGNRGAPSSGAPFCCGGNLALHHSQGLHEDHAAFIAASSSADSDQWSRRSTRRPRVADSSDAKDRGVGTRGLTRCGLARQSIHGRCAPRPSRPDGPALGSVAESTPSNPVDLLGLALYETCPIYESPQASVAEMMQIQDDGRSRQTIDPEQVPASLLQPTAEPFERNQPGEEGKHHAQQTGNCTRVKIDGNPCCGCFVRCLQKAQDL